MSRPNPATRATLALAEALTALADSIRDSRIANHVTPQLELMLVRHLSAEHLGCWIELPGIPTRVSRSAAHEPSVLATAGRLVGIRPGGFNLPTSSGGDPAATRILVIQQGTATQPITALAGDPVRVAPREWS